MRLATALGSFASPHSSRYPPPGPSTATRIVRACTSIPTYVSSSDAEEGSDLPEAFTTQPIVRHCLGDDGPVLGRMAADP